MRPKENTSQKKRTIRDWLKILVLLLDDAAALLLIILALRFFGVRIPLPITIAIALILGGFVFILHRAVLPSFRWRPVTGREGMIGEKGRVVEPLTPVGTVITKGEYWRAKSIDGAIAVDEDVEVVGLDGLTLKVKRQR